MLFRTYVPAPPLDRFIEDFWCYQGYASPHLKERILPDGTFKLVFNLQGRSAPHLRPVASDSIPTILGSDMIRDFLAFSGLSPVEYATRQRAFAARGLRTKHNHIPVVEQV